MWMPKTGRTGGRHGTRTGGFVATPGAGSTVVPRRSAAGTSRRWRCRWGHPWCCACPRPWSGSVGRRTCSAAGCHWCCWAWWGSTSRFSEANRSSGVSSCWKVWWCCCGRCCRVGLLGLLGRWRFGLGTRWSRRRFHRTSARACRSTVFPRYRRYLRPRVFWVWPRAPPQPFKSLLRFVRLSMRLVM